MSTYIGSLQVISLQYIYEFSHCKALHFERVSWIIPAGFFRNYLNDTVEGVENKDE